MLTSPVSADLDAEFNDGFEGGGALRLEDIELSLVSRFQRERKLFQGLVESDFGRDRSRLGKRQGHRLNMIKFVDGRWNNGSRDLRETKVVRLRDGRLIRLMCCASIAGYC